MSLKQITNNSIVPIRLGLLASLTAGVWILAMKFSEFTRRLEDLESAVGYRWTYLMERESWREFREKNPGVGTPDIDKIREIYQP